MCPALEMKTFSSTTDFLSYLYSFKPIKLQYFPGLSGEKEKNVQKAFQRQ